MNPAAKGVPLSLSQLKKLLGKKTSGPKPRRDTRTFETHSAPELVTATRLRLRLSSRRRAQLRTGPWFALQDWAVGAKTGGAEMTQKCASAGGLAARWLLGAARLTFFRRSSGPRPLRLSAPWRDSALRAGEDSAIANPCVQASAFLRRPLSSPSRLLPFRSQWRRGRPSGLSENGGSEAGGERPGFPAGAERRGLQTRRGQVHHARVRPGPTPVGPFCPPVLSFRSFPVPTLVRSPPLRTGRCWPQPQAAAQIGLSTWV